MTYQLTIMKDSPIGFWPLDESSGSIALDKSGCGNNGTYTGSTSSGITPLVKGGIQGTLITNTSYVSFPVTKDYTAFNAGVSFARSGFSDNDFSLEVWFYPKITTSAITPIFADSTNNIGIYWENGTIVFRLQNEYLYYTPSYIKKSFHIVATYDVSSMSLYVDGFSAAFKPLTNFNFTNTSLNLSCGPTTNSSNSFIVDAPAVYRYSLSLDRIVYHFYGSLVMPPIQVVKPDGGLYFPLTDQGIKTHFKYSYPYNKPWKDFLTDDTIFDSKDQSLTMRRNDLGGSKTVTFTDYITIPLQTGLITSKIDWDGDNGISVFTSLDGDEISYQQCINGRSIPQYSLDNFNETTGQLYIKVVMTSSDISKHTPKLRNLIISFFQEKRVIGYNTGLEITHYEKEYHLGSAVFDILSRDEKNGLRCSTNGGFSLINSLPVKSVEFFYTPSGLVTSGLVSASGTNYSWSSGAISKTNILAIYVNGVNKTSETDINNVFKDQEICHVVIVFNTSISTDIIFNYSSLGSTPSIYQNLAIYESELNSSKALEHYNLYTASASSTADDSSMTLTENSVKYYNNDWLVIQSV